MYQDIIDVFGAISLSESAMGLATTMFKLLFILLVAGLLNKVVNRIIFTAVERLKHREHSSESIKRVDTLSRVCRSVATITIWVVAFTIMLSIMGFSISPILTTAGVSGIAIGFAAQSLIKDYFSGFIMLLEGQMRVGDIVEIGGVSGLVEEMTLRCVRLRNLSGEVIFVPNGNVVNVVNKSLNFAFALIDVGIAYKEDIDQALNIMEKTAKDLAEDVKYKDIILASAEILGVDQWADSSIVLRMRIKVSPGEQWGVRREFLRRLKYAFDRSDIEIPFPHITLFPGQLKDGSSPPINIHNVGANSV